MVTVAPPIKLKQRIPSLIDIDAAAESGIIRGSAAVPIAGFGAMEACIFQTFFSHCSLRDVWTAVLLVFCITRDARHPS